MRTDALMSLAWCQPVVDHCFVETRVRVRIKHCVVQTNDTKNWPQSVNIRMVIIMTAFITFRTSQSEIPADSHDGCRTDLVCHLLFTLTTIYTNDEIVCPLLSKVANYSDFPMCGTVKVNVCFWNPQCIEECPAYVVS